MNYYKKKKKKRLRNRPEDDWSGVCILITSSCLSLSLSLVPFFLEPKHGQWPIRLKNYFFLPSKDEIQTRFPERKTKKRDVFVSVTKRDRNPSILLHAVDMKVWFGFDSLVSLHVKRKCKTFTFFRGRKEELLLFFWKGVWWSFCVCYV